LGLGVQKIPEKAGAEREKDIKMQVLFIGDFFM
jgi:hypothetical protein